MMNITRSDLARFCPRGDPAWIDAFASQAPALCEAFGITTRGRWRHFAAQWYAETDGLTLPNCRENMHFSAARLVEVYRVRLTKALAGDQALRSRYGTVRQLAEGLAGQPTATANVVYGYRPELGNVQHGDGALFIGRSPLQCTGREIYELIARETGIPCVAEPAMLEHPVNGVPAAFVEWQHLGCNELADGGDVEAVSKRVNGGSNGLAERQRAYARALAVWPDEAEASIGETSPVPRNDHQQTRDVQTALARLGYHCGVIDGIPGILTRRALVAFQSEHAIPPTGNIDAATLAALAKSAPADLGARATVTAKELASRGSATVAETQRKKAWVRRALAGLGLKKLDQLADIGIVDTALKQAEQLKSYADRLAALVPLPLLSTCMTAAAVVGLSLMWWSYHRIEVRRIADARSGANLGR
jgi:putative chitinase